MSITKKVIGWLTSSSQSPDMTQGRILPILSTYTNLYSGGMIWNCAYFTDPKRENLRKGSAKAAADPA